MAGSVPRLLLWWLAGLLAGLLVVGPAWSGDALLNLDLVVFDRIPVSQGVWGLGPEIPRQAPAIALLAITSAVVAGPTLIAVFMISCVAVAFVGASHLARPASWHARAVAGALYALSPWLLTRIAVGHLGLALAAALLPWVLPILLRPDADLRKTFLGCAAMSAGGYFGGTLAFVAVAVGVIAAHGHRWFRVTMVWTISQLPWLVPGAVVAVSAPNFAGGEFFRTVLSSGGDYARLVLGYGFWQRGNQLGLASPIVPVAGLVILCLAIAGARELPSRWSRPGALLAGTGLFLAAVSATPLLADVFDELSATLPGAAFRESNRGLVLFLVWAAPATAQGIARLERHSQVGGVLASAGCIAIIALVISPALWGLGGRTSGVELPDSWDRIRARVESAPGTTLALPWNQYFDLDVADGRRNSHPVPSLIRADVLNSSNPELGPDLTEAVDPREIFIEDTLTALGRGRPAAESLASIGVRWVVVVAGVDDDLYSMLRSDPGLRLDVADDTISLYEVTAWPGRAVDLTGESIEVNVIAAPLARISGGTDALWFVPGASGWMRWFEPASTTPTGVLGVPAGSGPVWYWPTLVVLTGYVVSTCGLIVALSLLGSDRCRAD